MFEPDEIVLGRYMITGMLGRGGVGDVFLASRPSGSDVALKVLAAGIPDALARFEREARVLALVQHPAVVEIIDFGLHEDVPVIVMEFVPGETLEEALERDGPLAWREAVKLMLQILSPLDAIHRAGLLHRDLKPANIMLLPGSPRRIKLLDLGIATALDGGFDLTADGALVGTPQYMAPEQVGSSTADERADLYAAGVVFFELLTGELPYADTSIVGLITRSGRPPLPQAPPALPEIPERLGELVVSMMDPDKSQRPAAAVVVRDALRAIVRRQTTGKRVNMRSRPSAAGAWVAAMVPPGRLGAAIELMSAREELGPVATVSDTVCVAHLSGPERREARRVASTLSRELLAGLGSGARCTWRPAGPAALMDAPGDKRLPPELAECLLALVTPRAGERR